MKFIHAMAEGQAVPLLISELIPSTFSHGFTTRMGGVSRAPYDSLNLGYKFGDERQDVHENRKRVLGISGGRAMHFVSQVHGASVVHVRAGDLASVSPRPEADGLVTDCPEEILAVFAADCVPVLIADAHLGVCAAVHAGWRGVALSVVPTAMMQLQSLFGSAPADLRVVMGPAIGACCFEVGPEVVEAIAPTVSPANFRGAVLPGPGGKRFVDLKAVLRAQLLEKGVAAGAIDLDTPCTKCDPSKRFFSYRRDAGQTGQHIGFIGRRAPTDL